MIDAILRVVDRLIELRRYGSARLQKQYQFLIQPVMVDLERVQGNYLEMFASVRDELASGKLTLEQAIKQLERQRLDFEPVRTRLTSSVRELLAPSGVLPSVLNFLNTIV